MSELLLDARELQVEIDAGKDAFSPVDGVSIALGEGDSLAIVGESGSGKSLTLRSMLGLLPANASLTGGRIEFRANDSLRQVGPSALCGRGAAAMVFQEPIAALNPLLRCGTLIADAYRATHGGSRKAAERRARELMAEVGIPAPDHRMRAYAHELSGGLRQRTVIAMALATEPSVLFCDEPTTALDVTVQKQIIDLLNRIRDERGLALVYVTHDLAIVGEICDRIAVMYAGRFVETGTVREVLSAPAHPYTRMLLGAVPTLEAIHDPPMIGGAPPDPRAFPRGCRFHPRCPMAREDCLVASYELSAIGPTRASACIHSSEVPERMGEGAGG